MKNIIRIMTVWLMMVVTTLNSNAQKVDEERMQRDIQVAENVLTTLIKQQFNNQRSFFPIEIRGSYQAGYGITFTLPADFTTPIVFTMVEGNNSVVVGNDGRTNSNEGFFFQFESDDVEDPRQSNAIRLKDKAKEKRKLDLDSMRNAYNNKVLDAAKLFIVDYGDILTQLPANEKIVITNQGNQPRVRNVQLFNASKRIHLSVEMQKADLNQFKSGKLSREQALTKLKVINTETVDTVEPDLELLASMFNRLYSIDLAKTYFIENYIYYERLKDFGVIYYMQVFSSNEQAYNRFSMPTLRLDGIDLDTRNKKVKELYPKFEQELKENILDYGRTLKTLKDDEVLVFNVRVTRCKDCAIPSTLECTIKESVLKEFNAGKLDKNNALNKIVVKKGSNQ